jgi:alkylation response protein AidB-like acyl-CoA dehydrogenase
MYGRAATGIRCGGLEVLPMLTDLPTLLPKLAEREAADPEAYPAESMRDLYAARIPLAPLPLTLGGEGASCRQATEAIELLATASPSLALMLSMPLGLAGLLAMDVSGKNAEANAAWRDEIERIAADYRAGKIYAACNSEKGAGGSLAATKTVAARDGDGVFRLTGEKILASSGTNASVFFSTAKVDQAELPGAGVVEIFFVDVQSPGVNVLGDWDGFGMRSTESHSVRYESAAARSMLGFPDYLAVAQPLQYWFCLFAAIPLGCARSILYSLGSPAPQSPALRLRLAEAQMRYESLRAYLMETASEFRPSAGPAYAARVLRTKTFVSQESTKLCAELFALSGGRHYSRKSAVARTFADAFAGTALRPPLALGLDTLVEQFSLE